jgi:hypothetical protein
MSAMAVLRVALGVGTLLLLGCADKAGTPLTPVGVPYLTLRWSAMRQSTAEGEVVELTARISNRGRFPAVYYNPCVGPAASIEIIDPEYRNVANLCLCPGRPCPVCIDMQVPIRLEPGQAVSFRRSFDGTLEECAGPFEGAPGGYYATVEFRAYGLEGTMITLNRSLTFEWPGPTP